MYQSLRMSSVDGLLCEVTALLGSRLCLKSAEQAYFGNKSLTTCVPLTCSTAPSCSQSNGNANAALLSELTKLREENAEIRKQITDLKDLVNKLLIVDKSKSTDAASTAPQSVPEAAKPDGDDFDLFGSEDEEEDEEKKKLVEERLKAYAEKKSKKPGPIAKSSVILDVKPWDDETSLEEMEKHVRSIEMDGLVWGGAKLIAIGYGIQKLQIISVVEDAKVSIDDLIDKIQEFEDHVQSVDIVAFNKI